jgi:hypothetical protein
MRPRATSPHPHPQPPPAHPAPLQGLQSLQVLQGLHIACRIRQHTSASVSMCQHMSAYGAPTCPCRRDCRHCKGERLGPQLLWHRELKLFERKQRHGACNQTHHLASRSCCRAFCIHRLDTSVSMLASRCFSTSMLDIVVPRKLAKTHEHTLSLSSVESTEFAHQGSIKALLRRS